jgi:SAM-dependent methyltransferase
VCAIAHISPPVPGNVRRMDSTQLVDEALLEQRVQEMYRAGAQEPGGDVHFEMGRELALRLGYDPELVAKVPAAAVESFAGVGHFLDLADLKPGERVVDLGSGSGTDLLAAALQVGAQGQATGVDMTDAQLAKAALLAHEHGMENVKLVHSRREDTPLPDESAAAVISNGVINLCPDKPRAFHEIARLLRPGGRAAIADIVSGTELAERTRRNTDLWAACIAGAIPQDDYVAGLEAAGLVVETVRENAAYRFISERAIDACNKYEVVSVSLLARKPG